MLVLRCVFSLRAGRAPFLRGGPGCHCGVSHHCSQSFASPLQGELEGPTCWPQERWWPAPASAMWTVTSDPSGQKCSESACGSGCLCPATAQVEATPTTWVLVPGPGWQGTGCHLPKQPQRLTENKPWGLSITWPILSVGLWRSRLKLNCLITDPSAFFYLCLLYILSSFIFLTCLCHLFYVYLCKRHLAEFGG